MAISLVELDLGDGGAGAFELSELFRQPTSGPLTEPCINSYRSAVPPGFHGVSDPPLSAVGTSVAINNALS